MCGIFGIVCASDLTIDRDLARSLALSLLRFSQTRGSEAAGIAVHDGERIEVLKQGGSVADFLANPKLHALLEAGFDTYDRRRQAGNGSALAIVGHSRLATNGSQSNCDNNQPVITRARWRSTTALWSTIAPSRRGIHGSCGAASSTARSSRASCASASTRRKT
jgi:glutamine phosphoribosylpyrophosphate amidotransferase